MERTWRRQTRQVGGRLRHILAPLLAVGTVVLGGCGLVEPEGCDICTTSAIVEGRITYEDGSPVSGVQLDIRAFEHSCTTEPTTPAKGGTDNGWPIVANDGSYEARPISLFGPFTARCFVLTLNPRDDSRWLPRTSAEFEGELEFRADYKGPERDRLQIDWVLTNPDE